MPGTTLVGDVMTRAVATLAPGDAVAEAADRMADGRWGAMPVVDDDDRLLGLLRDEDLIVSEARIHVPTIINFLGAAIPLPGQMAHFEHDLQKVAGANVGEIMDPEPPAITEDAPVEDLATLMHDRDVSHVPVVDRDGRLVGIVARGDIVRLIARTT